jgi:small conductance mechanosensitive channel
MDFEHLVLTYVVPYSINIALAIVIFIIGKVVIGWLEKAVNAVMVKMKVEPILIGFVISVGRALLYVILVVAILGHLGFDTTSLVAILAAASLAVGLALKDSLNNFASGVMLIITQPFKVGDFIEANGQMGVVEKVSLLNCELRTGDNRQVVIPNGQLYKSSLINYSAKPTRRIDLVFGIHYDSDLRLAKTLLQDLIEQEERALKDPAPLVVVSELADSSVNFTVRIWVNTADYWPVRFDYIERVKLTFDENNIVIPFPQMDLHLQAEGLAGVGLSGYQKL